MSTKSLVTVFLDVPVMRQVERIELPSTSAAMIARRFSMDRRFILTIMPEGVQVLK